MRRRDTIIIAVLVNAGLLLVLFATALRSDKKKEEPLQLSSLNLDAKAGEMPLSTEDLLNEYIASTTSPTSQKEGEEIVEIMELPASLSIASTPVATPTNGNMAMVNGPVNTSVPFQQMQPAPISSMPAVTTPSLVQEVPVSSAVEKEAVIEVTVKKGDYLDKIAKANNTSVNAIMKASNITSTQLKIGQVLKIPVNKAKVVTNDNPIAQTDVDYYIVKEGDSPWAIANKCHVKLDDLLKLNNIDDQKAKRLRPGDKLRIR